MLPHLVQSNNERSLSFEKNVDGLKRLWFKTMHHIHHQNGYVTQRGPSSTQVAGVNKKIGKYAYCIRDTHIVNITQR